MAQAVDAEKWEARFPPGPEATVYASSADTKSRMFRDSPAIRGSARNAEAE